MNFFFDNFKFGWNHIIDSTALDHIFFVIILAIPFAFKNYKKVFLLITAFTLGHSLSLLTSYIFKFNANSIIIENVIKLTIIVGALYNLYNINKGKSNKYIIFIVSLIVGIIHGLAYFNELSIYFLEDSYLQQIVYLTIGVECGHLLIAILVLVFNYIIHKINPKFNRLSVIIVSCISILIMMLLFFKS